MTALAGTNWSFGGVVDGLFSIGFTLTVGNMGLQGLSKIAAVGRRGVNEALKTIGFDTSSANSRAARAAAWVPTGVSNLFIDESGYNAKGNVVPLLDKDKNEVKDKDGKAVMQHPYQKEWSSLLISGLVMSVTSLVLLDAKETLWKPAHPLLNRVLSYISPIRAVLGQSWVADGINSFVGAARSRI